MANIRPIKASQGDLVLVEVRSDVSEERRLFLKQVLEETAEESDVHFLVLPEHVVSDFRALPLAEMISMRGLLDASIMEALQGAPIGEA